MDDALRGLAKAAESGDPRPRIRLLTTTAYIEGKVVSDTEAQGLQQASLGNNLIASRKVRKKDREAATAKARQEAAELMPPISGKGDALNLELGTMHLLGDGTSIQTLVVRVPFDQVTTWWVGDFALVAPKGGGGGWFVGGFVTEG